MELAPIHLIEGKVWAGLNHTRQDAWQERVLAHILVVVGQLESGQVSLEVSKLFDGAN